METKITAMTFSDLEEIIQGREPKAAEVLEGIAQELEATVTEIHQLEKRLAEHKTERELLIERSRQVVAHIEKKLPLVVQRKGCVVVVSETYISIERNVIQ